MLRTLILAAACLISSPAMAADVPPPLFTAPDTGAIRVMRGDSGDVLPVNSTKPEVRAFVERGNQLLAKVEETAPDDLKAAIEDGRRLQDTLETELVGTLYLEESLRRLKRARLAMVSVEETDVVRAGRSAFPERLDKPLFLRRGMDDLSVSYATFAACLERANFPSESGPREVRMEADGTLWTRVNGQPLAFDIVTYGAERMLLRSVIIGASRSLGFKEKLHVARLVLDMCI